MEETRNSSKKFKFTPTLVIMAFFVIVLLVALGSSFFVVDATEQAVITRFGKYVKTVGPGLQFKLPFGIDRNYNIPTPELYL